MGIIALQVLAVLLVSIAMALSLAHALELPSKMRLSKEAYLTTQQIYYPGFTIGGISEPAGLLAVFILLFITQADTAFWLTFIALLCLIAMHAVFWLMTQPVNKYWLKDMQLKGASGKFFAVDAVKRKEQNEMPDWTVLRDCWERSHVIRAVLSFIGLAFLVTAVAL
jgi:hypothetical protein